MPRGGVRLNAGRKRAEDEGPQTQILFRVKPSVRKRLDQIAKQKNKSLSWVVQTLIEKKLASVDWRGDHHYWFSLLIARVAWQIEQRMQLNPPLAATSKGWIENAFAREWTRKSIAAILDELFPSTGDAKIPDELRRSRDHLPPSFTAEQIEYLNSPEGLAREFARDFVRDLHFPPPLSGDDVLKDFNELPMVQDAELMTKIAIGLALIKKRK